MELQNLKELVEIDSPSGFTEEAARYVVSVLEGCGLNPVLTHKGGVRVALSDQPEVAQLVRLSVALQKKVLSESLRLEVSLPRVLKADMFESEPCLERSLPGPFLLITRALMPLAM